MDWVQRGGVSTTRDQVDNCRERSSLKQMERKSNRREHRRYVLGVFVVLGSTYVCMPSSDKSSGGGGMAPTGSGKVGSAIGASNDASTSSKGRQSVGRHAWNYAAEKGSGHQEQKRPLFGNGARRTRA